MASPYSAFSAAVHDMLGPGWWSNWPLSTRHSVGDICRVANGQLLAESTLARLGIIAGSHSHPFDDALSYDQNGAVDVTFKVAGSTGPLFSALAAADAGAHLSFTRDGSVFAAFTGLREQAADDPRALARPLATLYLRGQWDPDWAVVTHVLSAGAGTVMIAERSGAEAELRLSAEVGAGGLPVTELAGQSAFTRKTSIGFTWTADRDSTPFIRVLRIRRTWLGQIDTEYAPRQKVKGYGPADVPPRVLRAAQDAPESVLEEVSPADAGISSGPGPSSR